MDTNQPAETVADAASPSEAQPAQQEEDSAKKQDATAVEGKHDDFDNSRHIETRAPVSETLEHLKDTTGNDSEDSEAGQLVIALSPKPTTNKSEERSPPKRRKRRSTASEELAPTPQRVLPGRMKGKGMAYLLAIEKGGSKRLLAQAQAKVEAQTQAYTASLYAAEKESDTGTAPPSATTPTTQATPKVRLSLVKKDKSDDYSEKASFAGRKDRDESMEVDSPTDEGDSGHKTPDFRSLSIKKANNSNKQPIDLSSPLFKVPFDYGWKRELVYRSGTDSKASKNPVEVNYIGPCGKKLRSAKDLAEYLLQTGSPLSSENFSFGKEPIGLSSEFEMSREIKKRAQPAEDGEDKITAKKEKAAKKAEADELRHKSLQALRDDLSAVTGEPFGWSAEAGGPEEPAEWLSEGKKNKKSKTGDDKLKVRLWSSKQGSREGVKENEVPPDEHSGKKSFPKCGETCIRPGVSPARNCVSCQADYHLDCVYGMINENLCIACNQDIATSPAPPAKVPKAPNSTSSSSNASRAKKCSAGVKTPRLGLLSLEVVNGKRFIAISRGPDESSYMEPADTPSQESPRRAGSPTGHKAPGRNLFEGSSPLFMQQLSHAYNGLLHVFRFLTVQELLCAARVCKLWRDLALHHVHWRTVKLKNSRIVDWTGFTTRLRRSCTQHLDMRKMLFVTSQEETWNRLEAVASNLSELQRIDLGRCPARVLTAVAKNCRRLVSLDATAISTETVELESLKGLETLEELKIRGSGSLSTVGSWESLATLKNLTHLCLTTFFEVKSSDLASLSHLVNLTTLELGDCSGLENPSQAFELLSRLENLTCLRLEEGPSAMDGLNEIRVLSALTHLQQLELVSFGMANGLDFLLEAMPQLKRLLIIPEYPEQEDAVKQTVNHVSMALRLGKDLEQLCWVLTDEAVGCLREGFVQENKKDLPDALPNTKVQIVTLQTYATNTYRLPALEMDT